MNEIRNFSQIIKINIKEFFSDYKISVKSINKNEISIFINNEGFIIEKTNHENSIKIFLHKKNKVDLMFRSFLILYGNEKEKEYFSKSYNKLFFDTEEDLIGILKFLKVKYDDNVKIFFENNSMYDKIEMYFNNFQMQQKEKKISLEERQRQIYESMQFSKRIRFSIDGVIYLKCTSCN